MEVFHGIHRCFIKVSQGIVADTFSPRFSSSKYYLPTRRGKRAGKMKTPTRLSLLYRISNVDTSFICSTAHFLFIFRRDNVSNYSLYIAEDDGDVDWDFPCLDSREVISKFGFSYLAIVDRELVNHTTDESYPLV